MSKGIKFNDEARKGIESGINKVADTVGCTIGPCGLNVVLDKGILPPIITNDGVTIAKEIMLDNPYERMGAELIKEVAIKTNSDGGDGTTTSVVLARAIVKEGIKNITAGSNGIFIKKGIDIAVKEVVDELKAISVPIEGSQKIAQIASISANDEKIGEIIANAMDKVGKDGVITTENSKTNETYLDVVEGMQFKNGFISPYMITDPIKNEAILDNPNIVLVDDKISTVQSIIPLMEKLMTTNAPILIIADDIAPEVLTTLIINKVKGVLNVVAVKTPGYGDAKKNSLIDIAILTGGVVLSKDTGTKLETASLDMIGTAKKVVVTKDTCTIIEGGGSSEDIQVKIAQLKNIRDELKSDYEKGQMDERISKLAGGIGIIYVGANTETEQQEIKLRIEDALNATKAAVAEGIVPGGGVALTKCQLKLNTNEFVNDDVKVGYNIIKKTLTAPLKLITENSGLNSEKILSQITDAFINDYNSDYGVNAKTGKMCNMIESGIIDPVKVTRVALQNAASVAGMILTTNAIVVELPEEPKQPPKPSNLY